jgi:hypothetical protein
MNTGQRLFWDANRKRAVMPYAVAAGTLALTSLGGWLEVMAPIIGPAMLIALVLLPFFFVIDLEWLVMGILVLAVCSRLLSVVGAPSIINYAHFGLVLVSIISVLLRQLRFQSSIDPMAGRIYLLLVIFAVFIIFSALVGGWHALRPVVFWLMYAEPFLIVAFMLTMSHLGRERVRRVLMALALIQIPFALSQFAQHGHGDFVKGTMFDQGAGHHVLGALGVIGAAVFLTGPRHGWWNNIVAMVIVPVLLLLGVMSDAKQVYAGLAVALAIFALPMLKTHLPAVIAGACVLFILFSVGASLNNSLARMTDRKEIEIRLTQKLEYYERVADGIGPLGWWIGNGPGNGISRVALLTFPNYGKVPTVLVGDEPTELAVPFVEEEAARIKARRDTSAGSPFSSVLGVFSEIGIIGCGIYIMLSRTVWQVCGTFAPFERNLARTLLIMALLLGIIFTWLEEPVYMLYLAAFIGTLMPKEQRAPIPEPGAFGIIPQPERPIGVHPATNPAGTR